MQNLQIVYETDTHEILRDYEMQKEKQTVLVNKKKRIYRLLFTKDHIV